MLNNANLLKISIFVSGINAEKVEVGSFTIKTGRDDISEIGQTVEYNGQDAIYMGRTRRN